MRRFAVLFAATAAALGSLAAAQARANDELWIFIDGKNRGRVVVADDVTKQVTPSNNPFSRADGSIAVGDFSDCEGPAHYHGTWHGKDDPKPNACGWGHVVKVDPSDLPGQVLLDVAQAILLADGVHDRVRLSTLGCSPSQSIDDLDQGTLLVEDALGKLETIQSGGGFSKKAVEAVVLCLLKLQKHYEKLANLVFDLTQKPPLSVKAIKKFCVEYWKTVSKIEHHGDCFVKQFVKAFL